jgi:hypothetical protein
MKSQLQPLADWASSQGGSISGHSFGKISWNATEFFDKTWNRSNPTFPWMERHPDREISTALLASMSKFLPAHFMASEAGSRALAAALVEIANMLPGVTTKPTVCMMGAKGQAGLSRALTSEFHTTSLNPVLLDAVGTWLIMYNIPSLPQVPVSSQLLRALWPRLQVSGSSGDDSYRSAPPPCPPPLAPTAAAKLTREATCGCAARGRAVYEYSCPPQPSSPPHRPCCSVRVRDVLCASNC